VQLNRHDLAKDPPSRELLERYVDESHLEDFLNKRSPAYKERGLEGRKLTKREAIDLMLEDPNLIRRPIVVIGSQAVFGYLPDRYDEIIG
jgi:arsenate reductase-like glutaredoxin family protein